MKGDHSRTQIWGRDFKEGGFFHLAGMVKLKHLVAWDCETPASGACKNDILFVRVNTFCATVEAVGKLIKVDLQYWTGLKI